MCLAHSMLPDVTMSQWFDCQAPRAPKTPRAPSSPRIVTASALQHVTERPGKDQEISGTPQITCGGRMQQMEKAWVMADGDLMLIMGSKNQVWYIPTSFLKKVKNGTHAHKCQQLTISTASHQPSVFLNHMFWYVFSFFSDGSRYKSLVGGENEPEDENHMIGFRGCGRLPSSPWNWRWGNALVPLLSRPHVVVCCVWNWGVLSVEAESSEPESRWLQGFFCFKFSMVHAALDLCQKKG